MSRTIHTRQSSRLAADRFWQVLGASNELQFCARALRRIRGALARAGVTEVPVRLSRVARHFGIAERPLGCDAHERSSINYDQERASFVIRVPHLPQRAPKDTGPTPENAFSRNSMSWQRVTFAREFAHRFFFVRRQGSWRRALDLALEGLAAADRMAAFKRLHAIEERVCNRLASQVLVPTSVLVEAQGRMDATHPTTHAELPWYRYVIGLARHCEVTPEAVVEAMGRHEVRQQIPSLSQMVVLLIRKDAPAPRSTDALERLRVVVALIPEFFGSAGLRPIYAGVPLDALGGDACRIAKELLQNTGPPGLQRRRCSVRVMKTKGPAPQRELSVGLDSSWFAWETPGGGREVMVWGAPEPGRRPEPTARRESNGPR